MKNQRVTRTPGQCVSLRSRLCWGRLMNRLALFTLAMGWSLSFCGLSQAAVPMANNQSLTIDEDTRIDITLAATDAEGHALTYYIVNSPTHGQLLNFDRNRNNIVTANPVRYIPYRNKNGSDSFTFKANDSTSDSNIATVSIHINPVNDPPDLSAIRDVVFVATEGQSTTAKICKLPGYDPEADSITYTPIALPQGATLTPSGELSWTYSYATRGTYNFKFTASDGILTTPIKDISVIVKEPKTYYVDALNGNDTNPGTISAPWKTLSYALGKNSPVIGAGDTIYLRGKTYYESVNVIKFGTEEGGFLSIKNYPGETPVLDGSVPLTGWTHADEFDPYLTVNIGQNVYKNTHFRDIYWTRLEATNFPASLDEMILFEDRSHSKIASDPDQSEGYGEDPTEFRNLHADCYKQQDYLYDQTLTQETGFWDKKTGYWDEPIVRVLVYLANCNVRISNIAKYEKLGDYGKITFTNALGYNLSIGASLKDSYRLINHPHTLDSTGEFYVSSIENVNGTNYRRIYYWPKNKDNLTNNIRMASKGSAFSSSDIRGTNLEISGIKVFGYKGQGISFQAPSYNKGVNIIVKNCEVSCGGNTGIDISYYNEAHVENNYIRRCGNRGALVTDGDRCLIKGNDSQNNGSTNLSFYSVTNSMMIGNKVGGQRTAHGNGTSCYGVGTMIENLLVANNIYYACNSSFQNVRNITVFANLYYVDDAHMALPINNWPHGQGLIGHEGFFVYLHNTAYDARYKSQEILYHALNAASPYSGFAPQGTTEGPRTDWYMYNNIYHGFANWQDENWTNGSPRRRVNRENNIYTWYMYNQLPSSGWSLGKDEVECFIHDVSNYKKASHLLTDIFVNPIYGAGYWGPKQNGPAHGKGREIQQLLKDLGIKDNFPDYDFTKDMTGIPWQYSPSIGAYEYSDGNSILYGDANSDGYVRIDDAAMVAKFAVGLAPKNINTAAADVDGNGVVNIQDAALIAKKVVGLITEFPAEVR